MDAACVAELQASLARRDAVPFVAACRDALRQKAAFPALRQCVRELLAEVRQLARTNRSLNHVHVCLELGAASCWLCQ